MKPIAVHNPDHPTWQAQDAQFKRLFGLRPEQKWPDEGIAQSVTVPSGVVLTVLPKTSKSRQGVPRLVARCTCGRTVGAGRIQQHYQICAR